MCYWKLNYYQYKLDTLKVKVLEAMESEHENIKKRNTNGKLKLPKEDRNNLITIPAFDLSTKKVVLVIEQVD